MKNAGTCKTTDDAVGLMLRRLVRAASIGFAFLPKLGCPLCWPVLAGICNLVGLRFSLLDRAITVFTALCVLALLIPVLRQRRMTPHGALTLVSLLVILIYRLLAMPPWVGYAGGMGMLFTALWSLLAMAEHAQQGKCAPQLRPPKSEVAMMVGTLVDPEQMQLQMSQVCRAR